MSCSLASEIQSNAIKANHVGLVFEWVWLLSTVVWPFTADKNIQMVKIFKTNYMLSLLKSTVMKEIKHNNNIKKFKLAVQARGRGGTLQSFRWRCAAGSLRPLIYTRPF